MGLVLGLDDALRVLGALEGALWELEEAGRALGLRDELATVIRRLHGTLGLDPGGLA